MCISDWVYLIAKGKIIAFGSPEELRQNPDPRVQQFLQGDADGPVPFSYPSQSIEKDLFDGR